MCFSVFSERGQWLHLEIIIYGLVFISYILATMTYIGYINYFETSSSMLSHASWICAILVLLYLLWKASSNPSPLGRVKSFLILFSFTIAMAAMFRVGPVGNIAVLSHLLSGERVVVVTNVTRTNDSYFIYKGCRGKLEAFKNSILRDEILCGVKYEDWEEIKPQTPILLVGTKSYFGINFDQYAILTKNSQFRELEKEIESSGFVYLASSKHKLKVHMKRLIYRSFD